jgi:hypothetical protein
MDRKLAAMLPDAENQPAKSDEDGKRGDARQRTR